jgi:hypothetical protein
MSPLRGFVGPGFSLPAAPALSWALDDGDFDACALPPVEFVAERSIEVRYRVRAMKRIDLAVFPAGTPLVDAFSAMCLREQSAIVTVKGMHHGVITAKQIVRAIREGKTHVDDLTARRVTRKTVVSVPRPRGAGESRGWSPRPSPLPRPGSNW